MDPMTRSVAIGLDLQERSAFHHRNLRQKPDCSRRGKHERSIESPSQEAR